MRRMRLRLRTLMIVIAVIAILLGVGFGLRRRARRLEALALRYGREANRVENLRRAEGEASPGPRDPDPLMEQIHWNDTVANAYRAAAARPWVPLDPDPQALACRCGFHEARRAGAAKGGVRDGR